MVYALTVQGDLTIKGILGINKTGTSIEKMEFDGAQDYLKYNGDTQEFEFSRKVIIDNNKDLQMTGGTVKKTDSDLNVNSEGDIVIILGTPTP